MSEIGYMRERGFDKLTDEEKEKVLNWIKENLNAIKTPNLKMTAYGLKHLFEDDYGGFYITNRQMIEALLKCGFETKAGDETNRCFNISSLSIRAIKRRINKKKGCNYYFI